jgi:hypothetical protein
LEPNSSQEQGVPLEPGKASRFELLGVDDLFRFFVQVSFDIEETDRNCFYLADSTSVEDTIVVRRETEEFFIEVDVRVRSGLSISSYSVPRVDLIAAGDEFGGAVSSNDKFMAVGIPLEDGSFSGVYESDQYQVDDASMDSVAVHLYEKDGDYWQLSHIIKASNAKAGDQFGSSVVINGNQLFVSAPYEDRAGGGVYLGRASDQNLAYGRPDSGAVYVYDLYDFDSSLAAVESAYIKSPNNPTNLVDSRSLFGKDISVYKDRLAIGAPRQTVTSYAGQEVASGQAYLLQRDDQGFWGFEKTFSSLIKRGGEEFGSSVSVSEGIFVVGSPGDSASVNESVASENELSAANFSSSAFDPTSPNSGAGYIYVWDEELNSWTSIAYLKATNSEANDQFGFKVIAQANSVFVGAPNEDGGSVVSNADESDNSLINSGAVYHFNVFITDQGGETRAMQRDYIKHHQPVALANFGAALSADQDYLAIASPNALLDSGTSKGKVTILDRNNEFSIVEELSFEDGDPAAAERFGASLELDQGKVLIGAPGATKESVTSGDFRVYE